ncbi:transmembrane protein 9B-like isoform X2 [Cydia pomonella]|uniref:transmembrane protein 9B-like isoform X2 n=1 Tax=Cydia pomonella TaxID=82600 RepID=UPI002ADD3AD1|nr:transmembrane protein 9B-like isoform X2 [Cydia pomonella]
MITNTVILLSLILGTLGQVYEDKRCRCVCPSPAMVFNSTVSPQRKLYIADVPPSKCNCIEVVLPRLVDLKGREGEYCPRCECKYQTRNTTVIKVVVITVVWLIALLLVYAGFLTCLRPLMRRKRTYKDHSSEEARHLMQSYDEED